MHDTNRWKITTYYGIRGGMYFSEHKPTGLWCAKHYTIERIEENDAIEFAINRTWEEEPGSVFVGFLHSERIIDDDPDSGEQL
jgi:hypothetical protein